MTTPNIKFAFLFVLARLMLVINLGIVITSRDIWTDPLYDFSDRLPFSGKTLFWLILGALLLLALKKRSWYAVLVLALILLYLIASFILNAVLLAQFYLFNVSGWSSLRVLAAVTAPGFGQIILFTASCIVARSLQKSGQIT